MEVLQAINQRRTPAVMDSILSLGAFTRAGATRLMQLYATEEEKALLSRQSSALVALPKIGMPSPCAA